MIDLDELENINELYCRLGVSLCTRKIDYLSWSPLVKFLGLHAYIYPSARICNTVLLDKIYTQLKDKRQDLMWLTMLSSFIETHYSEAEQLRILDIILLS